MPWLESNRPSAPKESSRRRRRRTSDRRIGHFGRPSVSLNAFNITRLPSFTFALVLAGRLRTGLGLQCRYRDCFQRSRVSRAVILRWVSWVWLVLSWAMQVIPVGHVCRLRRLSIRRTGCSHWDSRHLVAPLMSRSFSTNGVNGNHPKQPDLVFQAFPSRRSVVYGTKGVVACSQPLAAEAGLEILRKGGNAGGWHTCDGSLPFVDQTFTSSADAAVAVSAALNSQ